MVKARKITIMKNPTSPNLFAFNLIVICCFFLTGVAGLIYQLLWLRMIDKVIGSAPFSVATVLSVFMGGLALGSFLAGKYIDRIASKGNLLSIFGKVEVAIGIYGLVLPLLIAIIKPVYVFAYNLLFEYFWFYQLFSFFGCSILLLIPTTLMGITLPVLCRFYVADFNKLGVSTGRLYGINTFGAFIGALVCGFLLTVRFGVYGSLFTAVGIDIMVGFLCMALARKYDMHAHTDTVFKAKIGRRSKEQVVPDVASAENNGALSWALCIFWVSGFCAMAYEVFWTRLLGLIIGPTTYSFTIVVSTFIVGLALGSMFFGWLADRSKDVFRLLVITQICAASLAIMISQFLGDSQFFFSKLIHIFKDDFGEMILAKYAVLFIILVGPTIFLGATFPLVNKIYTRSLTAIGKSIGTAYAVNTIGAIMGSFAAGYILIPFLGKENGLRLVTGIQFTVSLMALTSMVLSNGWKRVRPWFTVAAILILEILCLVNFPSWRRDLLSGGWYHRFGELEPYLNTTSWLEAVWKGSSKLVELKKSNSELVFYGQGIGGYTTVEKEIDSIGTIHYSLYNSGKADASTRLGDRSTQTLLAHVPLLFHPNPQKVMVLGLASGMTAGEALLYPVKNIDVLEINEQVIKACEFFTKWNNHCLSNPNTTIIVQDGRNHLELTREKYNVIISEPSNPWMAGLANLFSLEFFKTVKERLYDDGTFVQWIHSYEMDWPTFAMVGRTFAEVFPNGMLMKVSSSDFLLVGFKREKNMDLQVASNNMKYARKSTNITIRDPRLIFRLIVTEDLKGFFGSGPLHTDNRPFLEFAAPKNLDKFDASIADRIIKNGWLSIQTMDVIESYSSIDSSLDVLELSLAQSSPSFDVNLYEATSAQRKRFQDIMKDYCSNVLVDNYEIFPSVDLKTRCADIQVAKINEHLVAGYEDGIGYYKLAVAYRNQGNNQKEIDTLRKAIHMEPSLYDAYNNLGIALTNKGKYEEAFTQLSEALRIRPGNTEVLNNLGNVFAAQGKTTEAIDYYSRALQIKPGDVKILDNLGDALAAQGKTTEAINYYSRAIQIKQDCTEAHYKLAHIYINQGRFNDAMTHFNELLRTDSGNEDFYSEAGAILAVQGKTSEAKDYFIKALSINPNHFTANYNLGLVLTGEQQFELAAEYLLKAIEINPNDSAVHNALGVVLGNSGKIDQALHQFAEALKLNPDDTNGQDNMGLALMQMGRLDEAAAHFSKALEINNSFDSARKHLETVKRKIEKEPTIP